MSGMPPGAPAGSFSGTSATMASVVRMFLAIEAAFWSAERERLLGDQERDTTARNDALLEGGPGGLQRVLDAVLLLLHLGLGGCADLDDRDTARQLGETLLELLAIEVGVGVVDLGLDLV